MATVASVITSGRYDLRDASSVNFTDAELLDYLNRLLTQLDMVLASLGSDWTHATESGTDLSDGDNSVSAPSDLMSVRSIYIDEDQLIPKSVDYIYYKRKHISADGKPDYYALEGSNIIFERESDDDYTDLVIHYDKYSAALTDSGDMPFGDRFNQVLRQGMVIIGKSKIGRNPVADTTLYNFFLDAVFGEVIRRNYTPRRYRTDF